MTTERLDRGAWQGYFDAMAKILPGKQAHIDVNSLRIGAQVEAAYVPLLGITYDRKNDLLAVMLEGLDHSIAHVREVWVDHDGVNLNSVSVTDDEGVQQIIRLRDPVSLPAPP